MNKFQATIKKDNDGNDYLELIFNGVTYELEEGSDFVRNERDPNIVALTYAGIIKISNQEGVVYKVVQLIKLTAYQTTIVVSATNKDGLMREAVVGRNKDNMQSDGKGDEDTAAHKKACVEAFLALYGIASSRFNIANGKSEPKKSGTGINLAAIDNSVEEDTAPVKNTAAPSVNSDVAASPEMTSTHAEATMPFGEYRGKKIFDILAADTDNEALKYFSRLFFKNQAIKGNRLVHGASFEYVDINGATEEQKKILEDIRKCIA